MCDQSDAVSASDGCSAEVIPAAAVGAPQVGYAGGGGLMPWPCSLGLYRPMDLELCFIPDPDLADRFDAWREKTAKPKREVHARRRSVKPGIEPVQQQQSGMVQSRPASAPLWLVILLAVGAGVAIGYVMSNRKKKTPRGNGQRRRGRG